MPSAPTRRGWFSGFGRSSNVATTGVLPSVDRLRPVGSPARVGTPQTNPGTDYVGWSWTVIDATDAFYPLGLTRGAIYAASALWRVSLASTPTSGDVRARLLWNGDLYGVGAQTCAPFEVSATATFIGEDYSLHAEGVNSTGVSITESQMTLTIYRIK